MEAVVRDGVVVSVLVELNPVAVRVLGLVGIGDDVVLNVVIAAVDGEGVAVVTTGIGVNAARSRERAAIPRQVVRDDEEVVSFALDTVAAVVDDGVSLNVALAPLWVARLPHIDAEVEVVADGV